MPERYNFAICALHRKRLFSYQALIEGIAGTFADSMKLVDSIRLIDLSSGSWTNLTSLGISNVLTQEPKRGHLVFIYYCSQSPGSGALPSISIDNDDGYVIAASLEKQEVEKWGQPRLIQTLASLYEVSSNFLEAPVIGAGYELSVDLSSRANLGIAAYLCAMDLIDLIVTGAEPDGDARRACSGFSFETFKDMTILSKRHSAD